MAIENTQNKSLSPLGRWAVIDIETTGIDPHYDKIIDIGFLQFDGVKLIKKYSSLVRFTEELSQFIQKLTGIKPGALKNAPLWRDVEPEVMELLGHTLIAHNAEFEQSFLGEFFKKYTTEKKGEAMPEFIDSLYYLGPLWMGSHNLKLETFITEFDLRDNEAHRGFEDSLDLLKVMLVLTWLIRKDSEDSKMIISSMELCNLDDSFFYHFFNLSFKEMEQLASEIDFDLLEAVRKYKDKKQEKKFEIQENLILYNKGKFKFDGDFIKGIFRNEKIRERLPNFRYRKSQEELALRVGQAFKNGVHAMIQAPTGTGKTLGYLIPTVAYLKSNEVASTDGGNFFQDDDGDEETNTKLQVLVATGTKTLQTQAMEKDVPELRKILGLNDYDLKIKRLVGSGNHLCELLFRENLKKERMSLNLQSFGEKFSNFYFYRLFFYNSRNSESPLLRDDLPFIYKMKHSEFKEKDRTLAVDFRACTGHRCPYAENCTYARGLKEAKHADIVIGNHSLMFSWPKSFPRPTMIVVDEAHKLEGEVTDAETLVVDRACVEHLLKDLQAEQSMGALYYLLGRNEISPGSSRETIEFLREETKRFYELMMDHWKGLSERVEIYFKKLPKYTSEFWNEVPMVSNKNSSNDESALNILYAFESLSFIVNTLYETIVPHASRFDIKSLKEETETVAFTRLEVFLGSVEDLKAAFDATVSLNKESEQGQKKGQDTNATKYCRSLMYHEKEGAKLVAAPIDVGRLIHDKLLQSSQSVVFTSATLGNANGDLGLKGMEWASGYSYLEPSKRFKSGFFLPAIYDYGNKTQIYLADDTPPFYDRNFVPAIMKEIIPLLIDLGGRSLLLFSARKRFMEAQEILLKELSGKLEVFVQGMGAHVAEDFKKSQMGVLVGMESMSEGIDIPGNSLEFVFVDKVPDLRMDLVIGERRKFYDANIGNEFTDYYLAHRTRSLHQKLGRLLRTESDRGGVIVVDSRVKSWKGRTMETFNRLMLPYRMNRASLKQATQGVRDFLLR